VILKKFAVTSPQHFFFLLFRILIEIDVLLEYLNFGNRESLLERYQDYEVTVDLLEFCFPRETGWRERSVRGVVVVVKKPAVFPPNFRSFLSP
jgi:hypothetical protein